MAYATGTTTGTSTRTNRLIARTREQLICTTERCAPCIGRAPGAIRAQQWPCSCAFAAMKETRMPADTCPDMPRAAKYLARMTEPGRVRAKEWEIILTRIAMEQSKQIAANKQTPNPAPEARPGLRDRLAGVLKALCGRTAAAPKAQS